MRELAVGIMSGERIEFSLDNNARQTATLRNGVIHIADAVATNFCFCPQHHFSLHRVTIGVQFHWQRQETQQFLGKLLLKVESNRIYAINIINVEDYLASVISSEMSAQSHIELLKAHAVISRSWLLHPIISPLNPTATTYQASAYRHIKIYERTAHHIFDVCADDHCQRYQGITRQTTPQVQQAINLTRGQVLTYNSQICDARFHKCCGGKTEVFETCWADIPHPYLQSIDDTFCDTNDQTVLRQVLNDYDLETQHFHHWQVRYNQTELTNLIQQKGQFNLGTITDLVPVKRGPSDRIYELEIVGEQGSIIVGKELEIRRLLSPTHLYSSAFNITKHTDNGTLTFILDGTGWGHGVGLCQIGAAVMAAKGYSYTDILSHYFPAATLSHLD